MTTEKNELCVFASIKFSFLLVQILSKRMLPNHHSEDAFIAEDPAEEASWFVRSCLAGFNNWDAQHFKQIVLHGYNLEHLLVFYPLFPFTIKAVRILWPLSFELSAYTINMALSFIAFKLLNSFPPVNPMTKSRIGKPQSAYSQNSHAIRLSAFLFLVNPAAVFFNASYSEAMFFCMSMWILHDIHACRQHWTMLQTCVYVLSLVIRCYLLSLTRSNGFVSCVLLFCPLLFVVNLPFTIQPLSVALSAVFATLLAFSGVAAYASHQLISYCKLCPASTSWLSQTLCAVMISRGIITPIRTCPANMTMPYSYLQRKYWGTGGAFWYWQAKQLPNFLLALPTYVLVVMCIRDMLMIARSQLANRRTLDAFVSIIYVAHLSFLAFFMLIFMHVQVATRLVFSSSPLLYWYCERLIHRRLRTGQVDVVGRVREQLCTFHGLYFLVFSIVGTIAFSAGLPWT